MKITVIGDSIAAGQGCSDFRETEEVLMQYGEIKYVRCEAPSSWWGLLEADGVSVKNRGCCGAYSYQVLEHLEQFVEASDETVLILLGLNDRKRANGMQELRDNMTAILKQLKEWGKKPIVMTPFPSSCTLLWITV